MRYRFTPLYRVLFAAALTAASFSAQAQSVGVGTTAPDASAALDVVSSAKGALLPRLTSAQRTAIAAPATGLIVFQTDATPGFYYNTGTPGAPNWQQIATASGAAITASNGLTKTGQNIALGGTLTGATTIAQAGNAFSLTGGNVGIGTATPAGQFEVGVAASTGTAATDQDNSSATFLGRGSTAPFYQSFTAGANGKLQQLAVACDGYNPNAGFVGASGQGLLEVFAGSTPSGTALASQAFAVPANNGSNPPLTFVTFAAPATVTSGTVYCFRVSMTSGGPGLSTYLCTTNCYAGGASNYDPNWDSQFRTLVAPLVPASTTLLATSGSVGIGTNAPTANLDVSGSTRLRGLTTAGLVQTDASGNLSSASTASFGTSFIQNQNTADQVANFRINGTGSALGNFGIGTSNPSQKLDVNGTAKANSALVLNEIVLDFNSTNDGTFNGQNALKFGAVTSGEGIGSKKTAAGNQYGLDFFTGSTSRMSITNGGNVGIGTTAPNYKLEVNGAQGIDASNVLEFGAGVAGKEPNAGKIGYGTFSNGASLDILGAGTTNANRRIQFFNEGGATFNGNVGIGTISPTEKLVVSTSVGATANTTNFASVETVVNGFTNSTQGIKIVKNDGQVRGFKLYQTGSDDSNSSFRIASTNAGVDADAMTISRNTGNFGIGTTGPTQKLDVNGNVRIEGLTAGVVSAAPDGTLSSSSATTAFGTSFIQNQNTADQAANFRIAGTGSAGSLQAIGAPAATQAISTQGAYLQWNRTAIDGETWLLNQKGSSANGLDGFRFGGVTTANVVTEYARFIGNGNFGIGTTAPYSQLANTATNVFGTDGNGTSSQAINWLSTTGGYAAAFGNTTTGTNGNGVAIHVSGTVGTALDVSQGSTINAAGTSLLRVNGNGNVGIGTSAPLATLAVAGAQMLYSGLNNGSARPAVGLARIPGEIAGVGQVNTTTPTLNADDGFLRLSAGGGGNALRKSYIDLSGYSSNADMNENIVLGTINTERMRITNTGYVGIGTTAPAYPLQVAGGTVSTGAGSFLGFFDRGDATKLYNWYATSGRSTLNLTTTTGGNVDLFTVTNAGNVGISTTAPTSTLAVNGSVSMPFLTANVDVTLTSAHYTVRRIGGCNTITLPTPSTCTGRLYVIICSVGSGTLNLAVTGNTGGASPGIYDDVPGAYLTTLPTNSRITVQSNGTDWVVLTKN